MLHLKTSLLSCVPSPVRRRGALMILGLACLIVCLGFVSFSVDVGMISLTRTKMQNAVDAAALAAAMEITQAVQTAPPGTQDITQYARGAACAKAAEVAGLNGIYVDPNADVVFGQRTYNQATKKFTINWSIGTSDPTNVVKVIARKENTDMAAPDAQLRLFFAGVLGSNTAAIRTQAVAFVEARDIVVVHDFSRSMNFDSYFADETQFTPPDAEVLANMQAVWDDLQPLNMGTLGFTPQWLTVSQANPNISVEFRDYVAAITSAETLKSVKLRYSGTSSQTLAASGKTGTFQGTGTNSTRSLVGVDVTVSVASEQPNPATVSLSGSPSLSATFAGDRKSVSLTASSKWSTVEIAFTSGAVQSISDSSKSKTFSGSGGNANQTISQVRAKIGKNWTSWLVAPAVTYTTTYTDATYAFDDTNANVKTCFGLNDVSYPYPSGSWDDYINYVRSSAILAQKGYGRKYGGLTFVQYVLRRQSSHAQTPALAWTRHYPFHAIKRGHELLCDFLANLGFNDHIGMVSYDNYHRVETYQCEAGMPTVDIRDQPLGTNYTAVRNLMTYKQANHYYAATNIGGGLRDAVALLKQYGRSGARPNILLMTDGNANTTDGKTTLPANWTSWFDGYDGTGSTYNPLFDSPSSSELTARYSLMSEVQAAVSQGYTIHTIAVGSDADWRTMKAIAYYAKGESLYVPGGDTQEMEANLLKAFHKIAGLVPPPRLLSGEE